MKKIVTALFLLTLMAGPVAAAENGGIPSFFSNEAPPALTDTQSGMDAAAIEPAAGDEAGDEAGLDPDSKESAAEALAGPPSGPVDSIGETPASAE